MARDSMMENSDEHLIAVHVCKACGALTERSSVNQDSVFSGLVKCCQCGQERDLNIAILGKSAKRPPEKA